MDKKYLGIDVGGTFIKIGIVDDAGNVSMRREVPVDRSGNEPVMETMMKGIDVLLDDLCVRPHLIHRIELSAWR